MDKLEILEKKIQQAADLLLALKEENNKLQAGIKFLENENKRASQLIKENDGLRIERKQLANRIEKVIRKIGSIAN